MIIYKITNNITGEVYIGQTTKTLEHRKKQHIIMARNDKHNRYLYSAMNKYGIENFKFEEIDRANSLDELNCLETYYILKYDSMRNGYNMDYGGYNNLMLSEIVKEKHDKIMQSDEVRQKISKSMKEYRKKNPFTEEHRRKLSEKAMGNKHFQGHKRTLEAIEATNKSHYKKVYCVDINNNVIEKFDNVKSAAEWWFNNGYNSVKNSHLLCDMIKRSNVQDRFIKGIKWIYE